MFSSILALKLPSKKALPPNHKMSKKRMLTNFIFIHAKNIQQKEIKKLKTQHFSICSMPLLRVNETTKLC